MIKDSGLCTKISILLEHSVLKSIFETGEVPCGLQELLGQYAPIACLPSSRHSGLPAL